MPGLGSIPDRSLEKRLALPAYLDELAARWWEWSVCDCTMAVANWIEMIAGVDPLKGYRGAYHTADEARETAKAAGGFLPAIGELFDLAGLVRTLTFEDGDVAAVQVDVGLRHVLPVVGCALAIRAGDMWVVKAHRGIVGRDFPVVHGWRL